MTVIINNQSLGFCLFSTNFYFLKIPRDKHAHTQKRNDRPGFFLFLLFSGKQNKQTKHTRTFIYKKKKTITRFTHDFLKNKQTNKRNEREFSRSPVIIISARVPYFFPNFLLPLCPPSASGLHTHTHTTTNNTRAADTHTHTHTHSRCFWTRAKKMVNRTHIKPTNTRRTRDTPPKNKVGGKIVCVCVI
jgi:hypothetical protein